MDADGGGRGLLRLLGHPLLHHQGVQPLWYTHTYIHKHTHTHTHIYIHIYLDIGDQIGLDTPNRHMTDLDRQMQLQVQLCRHK